MMRAVRALALLAALTIALGRPAVAQEYVARHGGGDMSMSADGTSIAFTVSGLQASDFVLFNAQTRRAFTVRGPLAHIGDLGWSADGDELTFVTSNNQTLSGEGRHVWRLRPADPTPTVELLAVIPHVRSPVLSADGQQLAAFEGIVIGNVRPWDLDRAYALFEHSIASGAVARRSEGQFSLPTELSYDGAGALYTRMLSPTFARRHSFGEGYGWAERDDGGRWSPEWMRNVRSFSFRVLPGEVLPTWPEAFPATGTRGGSLIRPLDDGRVALYSSSNPHTSADWYNENGMPRRPSRRAVYDVVAFGEGGAAEVLVADPLREGWGRTGGQHISSDGRVFAQVVHRHDSTRAGGLEGNVFMYFERGELVFELPITTMIENAPVIVIAPSDAPIMPTVEDVHRVPAPTAPTATTPPTPLKTP
jgi:hypothetical protein